MTKNKITERVKVEDHNFTKLDLIRATWFPSALSIFAIFLLSVVAIGFNKDPHLTSDTWIMLFNGLLFWLLVVYIFNTLKLLLDVLKGNVYLYDVPVKGHRIYYIKGSARISWRHLEYSKKIDVRLDNTSKRILKNEKVTQFKYYGLEHTYYRISTPIKAISYNDDKLIKYKK